MQGGITAGGKVWWFVMGQMDFLGGAGLWAGGSSIPVACDELEGPCKTSQLQCHHELLLGCKSVWLSLLHLHAPTGAHSTPLCEFMCQAP